MDTQREHGDEIRVTIGGDVSGQVAVGEHIKQTQATSAAHLEVTQADLAALQQAFADLKTRVEVEAPPEKKEAALERVDELQQAVTAKKPDLTTMEYVKQWFVKNVPSLAGAVVGIVVNPIVGKLVEAAGEMLAAEFQRRFGPEPTASIG